METIANNPILVFACSGPVWVGFLYLLKKHDANLDGKPSKEWVKLTIGEMLKAALEKLGEKIEKIQERSDQNYKELKHLFEEDRKYNHERLNHLVGQESVMKLCLEQLEKNNRVVERVEKELNLKQSRA